MSNYENEPPVVSEQQPPDYGEMLLPLNRWSDDSRQDWNAAIAEYYTIMRAPQKQVTPDTYDFTVDSETTFQRIVFRGSLIVGSAYDLHFDADDIEQISHRVIEEFFINADDYFTGPAGAEELLQLGIREIQQLRKITQLK